MSRLTDDALTIQGIRAEHVIHAESYDAAAAAVRDAGGSGTAVVDYGRHHAGLGHAPPARFTSIALPGGIVEHAAADMAIRVGGGATLGQIADALADAGQWLAIDGAPADMTIAEAIAHHPAGPRRLGFRNVAAQLLGLRIITGAGELITVGGRTVKNVAGYDVTRFMVGNLNGLGLIAEATLRTRALPEIEATLDVHGLDEPATTRSITDLHCSDAAPDGLLWGQRLGEAGALRLTYLGPTDAARIRREAAEQWLAATFPNAAIELERCEAAGRDTVAAPADADWRYTEPAVVKIIVPAGSTGDLVHGLSSLDLPAESRVMSLPSEGIVFVGGAWPIDDARTADIALIGAVERMGGLRIWMRRPDDDPTLPPATPRPSDWPLIRRIRAELDPHGTLNPGRIEAFTPEQHP